MSKSEVTEKEIESMIEEKFEQKAQEVEKNVEKFFESSNFKYMAEGFFGAFFTLLWLVLVVSFWDRIALFNDDFEKMMTIIYVTTAVNIIMYGLLVLFRTKWSKLLKNLVSNFLSIAFFIILLNVYPFAFGGSWDVLETFMKPLIYIVMVAIVIGSIAETVTYFVKGKVN